MYIAAISMDIIPGILQQIQMLYDQRASHAVLFFYLINNGQLF